jgi:hypothetical protein
MISVLIVIISTTTILITIDWRVQLALLATQYIGVFLLVGISLPYSLAIVKLVSGWIAAAVIGMALANSVPIHFEKIKLFSKYISTDEKPKLFMGRFFYFLTSILVLLTTFSLSRLLNEFIPNLSNVTSFGSLLLIGMGILQVSFFGQPFKIIIGLLTIISGFEIIYASIENSILIIGMLAVITLSLSFIGAYLVVAPTIEER